ncbi:hypothetical protein HAP48_0042610 [Bradyrhizobium septentrionale]|uniref:Uncharacterized protein n=1 Tax=Bradyrhizobium septentrionale TaxID=1404411 RepID=A0A973W2J2_9BRAD|nr:hypothetical protein [Bradyrhizobium septentrionale]UGY15152.1 hypothetical protein HAP48_0042610 [Bradyrhizobium septentrionale]
MDHLKTIHAKAGEDARPTGMVRFKHITRTSGRLQYQFRGSKGLIWIDVPHVDAKGREIGAFDLMPVSGRAN